MALQVVCPLRRRRGNTSHGTSKIQMKLCYDFVSLNSISFLGSGPDREQSPVEWGDFQSVRKQYLSQISSDFKKLHELHAQNNSLQSETLRDSVAFFVYDHKHDFLTF